MDVDNLGRKKMCFWTMMSQGSSVGIAITQRDGRLKNRSLMTVTGKRDLSLFNNVQTSSDAHPTSYAMCTAGSFPGGKAAG
jgi:hypothetical protein